MKKTSTKRKGGEASRRTPRLDYDNAAELIIDLLNRVNTPLLIKDAIDDVLTEAQNQTQIMITIPGGYDRPQLAHLFQRAAESEMRYIGGGYSDKTTRKWRAAYMPKPQGDVDELRTFAHHFAIAIRIARHNPLISATIYDAMADALTDFQNEMPSNGEFQETEAFILLMLETDRQQRAVRRGGK
jgi:hypothetical protein